jgi:hypothetical protein
MTSHANVGVDTLALTHPSNGTVKCRTVAGVETENPLKPGVTNHTVIRASPEQTRIRRRLGHLQSTVGAGEVTGRWKALGYEAQELRQVMNRWAAARTPPQRSQP